MLKVVSFAFTSSPWGIISSHTWSHLPKSIKYVKFQNFQFFIFFSIYLSGGLGVRKTCDFT